MAEPQQQPDQEGKTLKTLKKADQEKDPKTFGQEPEVRDPDLPENPDRYEVEKARKNPDPLN